MINIIKMNKLMNKGKILLICLAGLFAASCVKDNVDQSTMPDTDIAVAKKFVNTSSDAVAGKVLVYVDKTTAAQLEASNGSSYTGVNEIDDVAQKIGAKRINQLFNMKVNAAEKRELGMDRWFVVEFSNDVAVDDAAKALAELGSVQRVEFTKRCHEPNVDEPKVVDLSELATTRASVTTFPNDASFYMQWPLLNEGNQCEPTNGKNYTAHDYEKDGFIHPNIRRGYDINVVPAWELSKGRKDVVVAIIDQGVDFTHEDLAANMWVNEDEIAGNNIDDDRNGYIDDVYGYNFVDNAPIEIDDATGKAKDETVVVNPIYTPENDLSKSHGTHVAGTVAAVTNNGIGIAGVAGGSGNGDGVRIMTLQILGGQSDTPDQNAAARAMEYAADNGAVISQNSWGNEPGSITSDNIYKVAMSARYEAFNYFMKKKNHVALDGGIIVFAAGNESAYMAGYPGAYNEYISVTALGPDGLPASYTNYGPGCNIAAPGGEYYLNQYGHVKETGCVLSTLTGNKYGYMQGTSMATPHVSGVAALALSYAADLGKTYTVEQFKEILLTSVQDINRWLQPGYVKYSAGGAEIQLSAYNNKMGTGLIDTYRVMSAIHGTVCVPAVVGEENVINIMDIIADGQTTLKIVDEIIIPNDVRKRLGIKNETIFGNDLIFTCDNAGTGVIKIVLVAGGDSIGGGNSMGGMRLEKEIAIIAREGHNLNEEGNLGGSNGWL